MVRRDPLPWSDRLTAFLEPAGRSEEVVHDLHRDLRRTRFEGSILGRVLGASTGDRSIERPAQLRDLERLLGNWRDVEMTRALLRGLRARPTPAPEASWLAARERTFDREVRAHEAAAIARVRDLLEARGAPAKLARSGRHLRHLEEPRRWRKELDERRRRYLRALTRVDELVPAEPAHAFRQELRRLGVFYDLLTIAPWASPPRRPPKVQRVLDRLGRVHDVDRALARLAQEAKGPIRDEYARRLRTERRRLAEKARRALRSRAIYRYAEGSVRRKKS
ncbi:MAG: hypothetical protein L3J91_04545 [Thermoplasmata archaeon]|nr:hypothetical protein [Thermoplasmata archaeon]